MFKQKNILMLLIGCCLGVLVSTAGSVLADKEAEQAVSLPFEELRTFTEIFGRIKQDYVESVDDKELLENAIRGMLVGLDPHSSYLDAEEYKELKVGTTGRFGGLGIQVTMEDGFVKVISPIDDTPAQRAGMQSGDLIIKLDEQPVKGMTLTNAVKIMRGEVGSEIVLTVVRKGKNAPFKVTLVRDIIKVKSVRSRTLEEGFGYLRISSFQSPTGKAVEEAVNSLKKENGGELKGMVLDLRNNPGGVLNGAVSVSDAFLNSGKIVYTEGRIKDAKMDFNATPGDLLDGAPIVILINAGSASASEIVAGALQDHKRAIIMGSKSFGKGSVQTIMPTGNGGAVKMTTARYFTPSGRSIQATGIEPDIELERLKLETLEATNFKPIKEADLSRHLSNGNGKNEEKETKKEAEKNEKDEDVKGVDMRDYPLKEALNLLKGIAILR
ncbi:carboxyl-terminal processing protease [Bathymodiolus platifrons methanotrophic gill symbiont]|uniref:S41 family peptidase n=1 Tax=Bathymodiolus platifrons methanotrophic gill symbiont TaxID=113268 RepID=UPI000B4077C8|nr:S41 family peptidase [Bathymodiolus platifrons methanotrophic gill symbiont]MCK5869849.1 S41 family peptidase [Methyloprofundus sp.]TXK95335.1 peptidase S41 [Methylococcaceae bacterium CS4]TXK95785.1 peptidase S41 [Methylococcaceae bacterium CS5]TXL04698.1 peptidase S41 [Methylococcaceae bacterium CS1]TXL05188.1 peptidase S41 [Methylococcaceae bacterium CS3]TXL09930.1 peptidase S41 [Methylococcaceae bacterium CS2]TXL13503.1 peptidase S41 [Methylococcaceae bacterium HT4]TXL20389.1 peptida